VISLGAVGTGLGSIFLGLLADIFGRKKIMIASVTVFGLLSLCTVFVHLDRSALDLKAIDRIWVGGGAPLDLRHGQ